MLVRPTQYPALSEVRLSGQDSVTVPHRMAASEEAFRAHMLDVALAGLARVPDAERADTYAVSFFVCDEEDDPRRPTLTVGTNTNDRVAFAIDPPAGFVKPWAGWVPSDEGEARWNFAFWLQNRLSVVGDRALDPDVAILRERWLRDLGTWYADRVSDEEGERTLALDQITTDNFVRLAVAVARSLHDRGVVVAVFGRPVPIVVHELEYYDQIATQTTQANPPGLAAEFVAWVRSLGS